MKPVYDVFLSYRRDDGNKIAEAIYDYLTEKGLRVFFDKEKMIDGKYFTEQIKDNVTAAPCYLFIGTPKAFQFRSGEDWVREEIKLAMANYEGHESERIVLPLLALGAKMPSPQEMPDGIAAFASISDTITIAKRYGIALLVSVFSPAISIASPSHLSHLRLTAKPFSPGQ